MRRGCFWILIGLWTLQNSFAQVGIGTLTPDPSAELDIFSSTKGLLIPRIKLKSKTDQLTVAGQNAESLLIFNISDSENLAPGFYYWYRNQWNRLQTESLPEEQPISELPITSVKIIHFDYEIEPDDVVLICENRNSDIVINLPAPHELQGKRYWIRKESTDENFYIKVFGKISGLPVDSHLYTALPYSGWELISDGEFWRIID